MLFRSVGGRNGFNVCVIRNKLWTSQFWSDSKIMCLEVFILCPCHVVGYWEVSCVVWKCEDHMISRCSVTFWAAVFVDNVISPMWMVRPLLGQSEATHYWRMQSFSWACSKPCVAEACGPVRESRCACKIGWTTSSDEKKDCVFVGPVWCICGHVLSGFVKMWSFKPGL